MFALRKVNTILSSLSIGFVCWRIASRNVTITRLTKLTRFRVYSGPTELKVYWPITLRVSFSRGGILNVWIHFLVLCILFIMFLKPKGYFIYCHWYLIICLKQNSLNNTISNYFEKIIGITHGFRWITDPRLTWKLGLKCMVDPSQRKSRIDTPNSKCFLLPSLPQQVTHTEALRKSHSVRKNVEKITSVPTRKLLRLEWIFIRFCWVSLG